MKIPNFEAFIGVHCETTATGTLLKQLNIELSEAMVFGLGEGLGFIFWNMKIMSFPFIGGRIKPLSITKNLANNLNLKLEVKETTSVKKAWSNAKELLDQNIAIGLQLDSYYLEYFGVKIHFAGHFAAMYGYDDNYAYMVDTQVNGDNVKTSLKSLELARSEKGPMAANNLLYSLQKTDKSFDLFNVIAKATVKAIVDNATQYLNPPIKNIGYKGILKTSTEIKKWFKKSNDVEYEFCTTAMIMEKAGTGGAIFRNMYRDFLQEAYNLTGLEPIKVAHQQFVVIADLWTGVARLLDHAGKNNDESSINKASEIMAELSEKEYLAMTVLTELDK